MDQALERKLKRRWRMRLAAGAAMIASTLVLSQAWQIREQAQARIQSLEKSSPFAWTGGSNQIRWNQDGDLVRLSRIMVLTQQNQVIDIELLLQQDEEPLQVLLEQGLEMLQVKSLQELKQVQQELKQVQQELKQVRQEQEQAQMLIGGTVASFLLALSLLATIERRDPIALSFSGQLIYFLPEEAIGELGALQERLTVEQKSMWWIRLIILLNFLELLWVFYIQIKFDNLSLPGGKNQTIDDD